MTDPTYIKTPFAAQGDTTTIPDTDASSVNWTTGFTANYSKKLTEAGAKLVSRKELNGILNAITKAIRYIQIGGVAIWNNTFQTSFQSGSIIWKKNAYGYWLILEAKHDSPRNPDSYPDDWNWHTIAQYVNNKMKLDKVVATELSVGGMTLKNGAAQGCPTPVNGTDFANKQYVDDRARVFVAPDYFYRTYLSSPYTVNQPGFVRMFETSGSFSINGFVIHPNGKYTDGGELFPVLPGDVVTKDGNTEIYFMPIRTYRI